MSTKAIEEQIIKQADLIKQKKAQKELQPLVDELLWLKKQLTSKDGFDRSHFESVLTKRFFVIPSFEIYGGIAGLFDYGPPGCALQNNILSLWRNHFVLEEDMLELECTNLTPEQVLKTSGHVERFADYMVKDEKTGDIFRADHLVKQVLSRRIDDDKMLRLGMSPQKRNATAPLPVQLEEEMKKKYENILETLDNYQGQELGDLITKLDIRTPETNNAVTEPVLFNLMFDTQIGPTGQFKGYLRPETAQGHFINFKRLLESNNDQMPFASATIGKSFRNEISPRQGLLRVREFTMCEIEHFVHPERKAHPRFVEVKDVVMPLYAKEAQMKAEGPRPLSIGEAVASGMVNNETLGYFMARIYLFLVAIGIKEEKIRFRQHMDNEMAHYASDCWDAEIKSSYGWIESVGCADRSAYDLTGTFHFILAHTKKTGVKLIVRDPIPEKIVDAMTLEIKKAKFGPAFKKNAKLVMEALEKCDEDMLKGFERKLASDGKFGIIASDGVEYEISADMVAIQMTRKKINGSSRFNLVIEYTPNVIEPSFGIGRILYALLEHSFYIRDGDEQQRVVFGFPPSIAPTKALVVPISKKTEFDPFVKDIVLRLRKLGITNRVDNSSGSIGRRYARNDEVGTPFGITIDFDTVKNGSVTLRERDSTKQIRGSPDEIVQAVKDLVDGNAKWSELLAQFGEFTS